MARNQRTYGNEYKAPILTISKCFGNKIIVRIDKDEEILEQVKELALKESIRLAAVQALGAINSFTVGVYDVAKKLYGRVSAIWKEIRD